MAEAQNNAAKYKKAKVNLNYKFKQLKVTHGIDTDNWENKAQSLLVSGRTNRPDKADNAARIAKDGGGGDHGLKFKERDYIAELTPFLDRPNVRTRQALENWCASFKSAEAAPTIVTHLIQPTKMNAVINDDFNFDCEDYPALLQTFMRVVVGLMEKFYHKTHPEIHLKKKRVQFTLSCKMINCSEEGYVPAKFIQDSQDVDISTNYVVSVGESPTLRIVYQDLHEDLRPNIVHNIHQDKLTLWHNDRFTHRIEATGKGEAILLSIGLGNIEDTDDLPVFED